MGIERKKEDELYGTDRDQFFERHRMMRRLNDALGYTVGAPGGPSDFVAVHLAPMYDLSTREKMAQVFEGLRLLARALQDDKSLEQVEEIKVASWIVAAHSKLIEKLGFELRGAVSPEFKARVFANETRDVHWATMSKAAFIERYGQ